MKTVIVLSTLVLLSIVCVPAMAGKGGVETSTPAVDCGDANKEINALESGGAARIWINVPAGTKTDGLTYSISNKDKPITNPATFTVTACGDGYFYGDITLPDAKGSVTLSVKDADGANVGSDNFRLK